VCFACYDYKSDTMDDGRDAADCIGDRIRTQIRNLETFLELLGVDGAKMPEPFT
jgi:hypothetical protein